MKNLSHFLFISLSVILSSCSVVNHSSIRVATYNFQQQPASAEVGTDRVTDHIENVSSKVADIFLRSDIDVIAFQEVFTDEAANKLEEKLKVAYPYYIKSIDNIINPLKEKSGLMLFSKFPIVSLPNPVKLLGTEAITSRAFDYSATTFTDCCSEDCLGNKGVGMVRIKHSSASPAIYYDLVFTHLQAGGICKPLVSTLLGEGAALLTPPKEIRNSQLIQIRELVKESLGSEINTSNLIFMGDLNIDGDKLIKVDLLRPRTIEERNEWQDALSRESEIFNNIEPRLFTPDRILEDVWEYQTQLPSVNPIQQDRGLTSNASNLADPENQQRLDYVLFRNDGTSNIIRKSNYTRVKKDIKGSPDISGAKEFEFGTQYSDHLCLESLINIAEPDMFNCPADAKEILPSLYNNQGIADFSSSDRQKIKHPRGYQWYLINDSGAYSISLIDSENFSEFKIFSSKNLSDPIPSYREETLEYRFCDPLNPNNCTSRKGTKYILNAPPYYIAVKAKETNNKKTGNYSLQIKKIMGNTPEEAIGVLPNQKSFLTISSDFAGTISDDLWFYFDTEQADSRLPQNLTLLLDAGIIGETVEMFTLAKGMPYSTTSDSLYSIITSSTPSFTDNALDNKRVYIHIKHSNLDSILRSRIIEFGFKTNLMVIHSQEPFEGRGIKGTTDFIIYCNEEGDWGIDAADDIASINLSTSGNSKINIIGEDDFVCIPGIELVPSPIRFSSPTFSHTYPSLIEMDEKNPISANSVINRPIRILPSEFIFIWLKEDDDELDSPYDYIYTRFSTERNFEPFNVDTMVTSFSQEFTPKATVSLKLKMRELKDECQNLRSEFLYDFEDSDACDYNFSLNISHGLQEFLE